MPRKRQFGSIRRRASGRYQARYTGPDGNTYALPVTYDTEGYAAAALARVWADIQRGSWTAPNSPAQPSSGEFVTGESTSSAGHRLLKESPGSELGSQLEPSSRATLRAYSATWLASRRTARGQPLSPATRKLYAQTLGKQILPELGSAYLGGITPAVVRSWYAGLDCGPRQKAAAYSLLSTILATAVADELITANPCRIRGAGQSERQRDIVPATVAELEQIAAAMPEAYRLMVLLAGWCGLRFGELAELRRGDVDVKAAVVRVRRGVIRGDQGRAVKAPKTRAGVRDVHYPPHLSPAVRTHLRDHVAAEQKALLFPAKGGAQLSPTVLYSMFHPAREAAGRPDLRWHDLRHSGAVLAAATGATLSELMARLGHSTVSMAMRYQTAAADRDRAIAEALSQLATVTPISAAAPASRRRRVPATTPAGAG